MMVQPFLAQMALEESGQIRGNPARHMDSIGHHFYGPSAAGTVGPDRRPHLSGYATMQLAYGVDIAGGAQGQGGHVEQRAIAVVIAPQL